MTINQSSTGQALHEERLAVLESCLRHHVMPSRAVVDAVARIVLSLKEIS